MILSEGKVSVKKECLSVFSFFSVKALWEAQVKFTSEEQGAPKVGKHHTLSHSAVGDPLSLDVETPIKEAMEHSGILQPGKGMI